MEIKYWNEYVKRLLKSELVKRGISHEDLAMRLNLMGLNETKSSVDSKICRGTFSATFLIQCLHAIDCNNLFIEDQLINAAESKVEYKKFNKNEKSKIY